MGVVASAIPGTLPPYPDEPPSEELRNVLATKSLDGTYSAVASAIAGGSAAVVTVAAGQLVGNDIAGARYEGTVNPNDDASTIAFRIRMHVPPGVFSIWGAPDTENFLIFELNVDIPASDFAEGKPIWVPQYQLWIIFRRIPDEFAIFAGKDGLGAFIAGLLRSETLWRDLESRLVNNEDRSP